MNLYSPLAVHEQLEFSDFTTQEQVDMPQAMQYRIIPTGDLLNLLSGVRLKLYKTKEVYGLDNVYMTREVADSRALILDKYLNDYRTNKQKYLSDSRQRQADYNYQPTSQSTSNTQYSRERRSDNSKEQINITKPKFSGSCPIYSTTDIIVLSP